MTLHLFSASDEPRGGAIVSSCCRYRYQLWRRWGDGPIATVLGINPSTADAFKEDATTRKLRGFGERLGWDGYMLLNPFALKATDQRGLLDADDPVGPENDVWLARAFEASALILCAWGPAKTTAVRRLLDARLRAMAPLFAGRELWCLGTSQDGSPRHPLMLPYATPVQRWLLPAPTMA